MKDYNFWVSYATPNDPLDVAENASFKYIRGIRNEYFCLKSCGLALVLTVVNPFLWNIELSDSLKS